MTCVSLKVHKKSPGPADLVSDGQMRLSLPWFACDLAWLLRVRMLVVTTNKTTHLLLLQQKKFDFEITLPERGHPVEASQFANVSPVFAVRIAPLWFMENALVGQGAQLVGRP